MHPALASLSTNKTLGIGRFVLIFEDAVISSTYESLVLLCFMRNKHLKGEKIKAQKIY